MNKEAKSKKAIPPYLPFKTFQNFIDGLKHGIPNRIDRSLMPTMAGSAQSQLMGALKYLGLINENNAPTESLKNLVRAEDEAKKDTLKTIIVNSYTFIFQDGFDLKRATTNELQERFSVAGGSGDTTRKAMVFFMAAAKNAGIEVSPYIKIKGSSRSATPKPRRKTASATKKRQSIDAGTGGTSSDSTQMSSFQQILLQKFPSFNPEWSDEVIAKWFEAFNRLMGEIPQEEDEEQENNDQ